MRKNCSSDWEKVLKFEAEGREFTKFSRSLEQFIQTGKGQNNFWYSCDKITKTCIMPAFKFAAKIEMAFSQILAIRGWFD